MTQPKKIVMLGHFGVGKTSLVRRYVDAAFDEDYLVTLGVQVKKKDVTVDDQNVSLIIWDVEGNRSVSQTRQSYLVGSSAFVYVIDLSRPETFEFLNDNLEFITSNYPDVPIQVFGNKVDLIDDDNLDEYLEKNKLTSALVTSAKNGQNVALGFENLAIQLL
ncbi:MAG: Rab family GTPase [Gilvibacter sp.]